MEDPRAYPEPRMWYFGPLWERSYRTIEDCLKQLHDDICARLNAKDAEIAEIKASIVELDHKYARARSDLVAAQRRGGE